MGARSGRFTDELRDLERAGRRRGLRTVTGPLGREVTVDGARVLDFCSNDYLGLAAHPALADASAAAAREAGTGAGASRLVVGNHDFHTDLEAALAAFHGQDAALLFNSGYQANVGLVSALAGAGDVVFSDALNHASIIDGCRLSRARVEVYPHADVDALAALPAWSRPSRRRFVVTESVFSMDGDRAPLASLRELCTRRDALLLVDEAHAVGALGPAGRGVSRDAGVTPDVLVGTFGKAFGSFGAYVATAADIRELLLNRARSFVFTTALPAAVIAASRAALDLIVGAEGQTRRARLQTRVEHLRKGLDALGLRAPGAGTTSIFPVLLGAEARAMKWSARLLECGIYVQGIRPPTVPRGASRLRLTVTAAHREDDLDRVLQVLGELASQTDISERSDDEPR